MNRLAIYSGSIKPIANKEIANPSRENVKTTERLSLDSLARDALGYINFSASSGE
jgi:hypothetical protein